MRKTAIAFALAICVLSTPVQAELVTVPERTNYAETSLYADVVAFVDEAVAKSVKLRAGRLGTTAEGREIPLVIASDEGLATPEEARAYGLPTILIIANIHAGEIEGKEALQMILRDIVKGEIDQELSNQVVLLVPIFNADGNDKLGDNRGDDGPELAGIRYNGQNLDLNRDFVKLDTPEVMGLIGLIRDWDPVLFVDMHTTNGSYHQEPVTYTTMANENASDKLKAYMWDKMFPTVAETLRNDYGYESLPYGNFEDRADPTKGWRNHAFEARYSTNYVGLRNILTILDENYSHADFKTRVLSSHAFVRSILSFTHENVDEMADLVKSESIKTRETLQQNGWVTAFDVENLHDITIKSYEFKVEKIPEAELSKYPPWYNGVRVSPTEVLKDYTVPYYNRTVPTSRMELPEAYVIPSSAAQVIANLETHGIVMERLATSAKMPVEQYRIDSLTPSPRPSQGHIPVEIEGSWEATETELPAGSVIVPLRQPLARLVPVLLEPSSDDSLIRWGFLTSWIVPQWRRTFNPYPVLRLPELPENLDTDLK